jgi:hypothetical protein
MHYFSAHSSKEERSKQKYYCDVCDNVFFCEIYYKKHVDGKRHNNMVKFIEIVKNRVFTLYSLYDKVVYKL